jgi:hypothetical protein
MICLLRQTFLFEEISNHTSGHLEIEYTTLNKTLRFEAELSNQLKICEGRFTTKNQSWPWRRKNNKSKSSCAKTTADVTCLRL